MGRKRARTILTNARVVLVRARAVMIRVREVPTRPFVLLIQHLGVGHV